ncbi:hypothetical protein [Methylomarinovum caldicuralii]|uniref:hypothetical protein n=1 Tax=Methylomarinovum caldicuralii TaxID=438856 RepID=UPI002952E9F8|nr:hypothetical protein [Methylomarinovum caldicuralii]
MISRTLFYLLLVCSALLAWAGEGERPVAASAEIAATRPVSVTAAIQEPAGHCPHHCQRCRTGLSTCGCGVAALPVKAGFVITDGVESLPGIDSFPAFPGHTTPPPGKPPRTLA